jgi:hemerythrin superfamily protein
MKGIHDVAMKVEEVLTGTGNKRDAVSLLKADHRKVDALFKEFEGARSANQKQQLINQIIKELTIHATVEEDLVYPILEDADQEKTAEGAQEAVEEHHLLKMALAELADTPATAKNIRAKVCVLKELVKHHVKEEESELLPSLKKNGVDIDRLGEQILKRKQQLMADVARGGGVGKNKDRKQLATSSSTGSRKGASTASKSTGQTSMSTRKSALSKSKASSEKAKTGSRSSKSAKSAASRSNSRSKSKSSASSRRKKAA